MNETFFVYVTFILTIGYSIIKVDLGLTEMKFALCMPGSKFFLTQILATLASF